MNRLKNIISGFFERGIYMSTVTITKENFENEVLNSDKPVILDFWAGWCGPCKMLSPVMDEIAEEAGNTVKVGKVNIDEERELASKFRVMSIPTIVAIKDGSVVDTKVGVQPKEVIKSMVS